MAPASLALSGFITQLLCISRRLETLLDRHLGVRKNNHLSEATMAQDAPESESTTLFQF